MAAKRVNQAQGPEAPKILDAKLLAYCAMATGALLAAPPAEAAIVYSGSRVLALGGCSTTNTVSVDLDSNGINDFTFEVIGWFNPSSGSGSSGIRMRPLNTSDSFAGNPPSSLNAGNSIAPSLPWHNGNGLLNGLVERYPVSFLSGAFNEKTGYIGVRFDIGEKEHYGWIQYHGHRVGVSNSPCTIIDWAYETTPDYPIQAGQTTGAGVDTDGDGIYDSGDNCPNKYNSQQLDADKDGIGDVCDPTPGCGGCGQVACEQYADSDSDGIVDVLDNCPTIYNPQQLDADVDGEGDCCDSTPVCGGCGQVSCDTICAPVSTTTTTIEPTTTTAPSGNSYNLNLSGVPTRQHMQDWDPNWISEFEDTFGGFEFQVDPGNGGQVGIWGDSGNPPASGSWRDYSQFIAAGPPAGAPVRVRMKYEHRDDGTWVSCSCKTDNPALGRAHYEVANQDGAFRIYKFWGPAINEATYETVASTAFSATHGAIYWIYLTERRAGNSVNGTLTLSGELRDVNLNVLATVSVIDDGNLPGLSTLGLPIIPSSNKRGFGSYSSADGSGVRILEWHVEDAPI